MKTDSTKSKPEAEPSAPFSLQVDRADFLKSVTAASGATDRRTTIPILSYLKLVVADDRLVVMGTNLDTEVVAECKAEGEGSTCLPAARLRDLLKAMSGVEKVALAGASNGRVTLAAERVEATFMTLPAADFPLINKRDLVWSVALPEGVTAFVIGGASDVMSTEETRYYLNGVCIQVDGGVVRATATDCHRLISRTANLVDHETDIAQQIIPSHAVKLMLRVVGKAEAVVTGHVEGRQGYVEIASNGILIRTKPIDGTFPDWRRVVPADEGGIVEVGIGELRRSLAMAKVGSEYRSSPVKLCIGDGEIRMLGKSADEGSVAATMQCTRTGEMTDFGVNGNYLDAMAASMERMGSRTMRLQMKKPGDPINIMPDAAIAGSLAVLMPMRV